jgi:enoyl-CoA hydratase/carnithine racemase
VSCVLVERAGPFVWVWMNRPERRNALSLDHLAELRDAFAEIGESDAHGVVFGGKGPVFSAGHDFADLAGADLDQARVLLETCTDLLDTMQAIPQPIVARVHGLATAAGCQLVATADLAVAAESAGFAAPGGKGGWFCHTPMVAIGRNVGRKRALELALTGDTIDAATAADWGLVNRVVPDDELDAATLDLLERATRGSAMSKGLGKQAFYRQIGLDQRDAYAYAIDVMANASQIPDAQEGMQAFLEKRVPNFGQG